MSDTFYGGYAHYQEVKALSDQARLWLARGKELDEPDECHCFYPNGDARYTVYKKRPVHRCGR